MKYLVTEASGIQKVIESEKSLAHLSLDFSPSTDIQPISEEPEEVEVKKIVKKAKNAS